MDYQLAEYECMKDTLIHGDCLRELKKLENESVDVIITSPPYNLGNDHHTGNKRHKAYDDDMDEKDYQDEQTEVLKELYRVLTKSGSLFYNHKNRIRQGEQITPYEWLLKTPFVIKQELVWFNRSQNFDKIRFYPMTERIYWLTKSPKTKIYNKINHHDLFKWKTVGTKGKHTRAFPEELVRDLLSCCINVKTVLDPYCGSGTTCLVAKQMGYGYVGIDNNKEYIDYAKKRLYNYQQVLL